jgi:hypothetical protein
MAGCNNFNFLDGSMAVNPSSRMAQKHSKLCALNVWGFVVILEEWTMPAVTAFEANGISVQ